MFPPVPRPRSRPCPAPALTLAVALAATAAPVGAFTQRVEVVGAAPLPGLGVSRDAVAGPVQTATAAELDTSQALDLSSFMARRLGSVHLNEVQGNPLQADLNYRGFSASPLLGSAQGLSVYLDGVRLNQPFGDVVSWDLLPRAAMASIVLMPGSNPLFGLNTLGGALSVQTKDGRRFAGSTAQMASGSNGRTMLELQSGGSRESDGLHGYAALQRFAEDGWRESSPSSATQLFTKIGQRLGATDAALSLALAQSNLNGNGLQETRLLQQDWRSVYTRPDNTRNRSALANLSFTHELGDRSTLSGNLYHRTIRTRTFNGDLNDDSLDQSVYQPSAAERAALTQAGYTGFPTAGETALNTPFPKWRCLANALLRDEPAEKCNGVINQTRTDQLNHGLSLQFNHEGRLWGLPNQMLLGVAWDMSRSRFTLGSELGYLNPDRSVTGVGAFGDGLTGGDVDGVPYDTRVDLKGRTRTWSAYGSTVVGVGPATHLTVSGRYNRTQLSNRDAIQPGGGTGSLDGDHRYQRLNPAIGLTFKPAPGWSAYLGAGQGSRAPSSIELGCADPESPCKLPNSFAGDPPLKQVVTTTFEAGVRGNAPGRVSWSVGVFRSDNRDDLLFVADNAAGFGYFKNFGHTRREGLEVSLNATPLKGLGIGLNYTAMSATYRSPEVVNGSSSSANRQARQEGLPGVEGTIEIHPGDRIPLVPRHLLKANVDVEITPRWLFGADLAAISSSTARGNENGEHRPDGVYYLGSGSSAGYAVLNLRGEVRMTKGFKFFGQIGNALDRRYTTAAQLGATGLDAQGRFLARPFPANAQGDRPLVHSTFQAPGAPRNFSLGLKALF